MPHLPNAPVGLNHLGVHRHDADGAIDFEHGEAHVGCPLEAVLTDAGAQASFSVFNPRTGKWEANISKDAIAWTAAIPADVMFVGDTILVPRYERDYYDIPDKGPGFVASVPLPTQVSRDPEVIGTNAAMALFFAVLFGSVSTVFNSTLKENHACVSGWCAPITRVARRARDALFGQHSGEGTSGGLTAIANKIPLKKVWQPLAIIVLSALIYGFLDPAFGFTLNGLGLLVSLAIAIGVTTFAYEGLQALLSRKRFGVPASMRLFPAAIAIAIACVVVSRVMAFHPGYVFGIVGGLAFATTVEPDQKSYGRMVLMSAGVLLVVSLAAWFAAVPVAAAVERTGGFLLTTVQAALISIFVMGLEALLFGLLPIGFMDGEKVMRWSKTAWVAAFGAVAFAFWHVLLNPSSKYLDSFRQKNVRMMFILLAAYGLVTLVMYLYFRSRIRKETVVETAPVEVMPVEAVSVEPSAVAAPAREAPAPVANTTPAPPAGTAGWCQACDSNVYLTPTWGCVNGHAWDQLRDWYDTETGQPVKPYWT